MNTAIRAAILAVIAAGVTYSSAALAVTTPGTGTGPIPDTSGTCNVDAPASLVISFAVAGLAANTTGVSLDVLGSHTWVGDIRMTLAAPGGSPSATIFGDTGGVPGGGDSSDLGGPYTFSDAAAGDWWSAATAAAAASPVAAGSYRSTDDGVATPTTLNTVFAGLTPAQANGTWTLTVNDDCPQDSGSITTATLTVTEPLPDAMFQDGFEEPISQ